jgi:DHA1 family quinolone resistance protein-like MFS transporter
VFLFYTLAPDFIWIIPLQIILAFSYSFLYVGDLLFLTRRNKEKAISVGILNSVLGICIGFGPLFGGLMTRMWSFQGVMYVASLLSLTGFLVMHREK